MNLSFDPKLAARTLRRADPFLTSIIDRAAPFALNPEVLRSPFDALLRAIIYQQLSGKAAGTIYSRVAALFPRKLPRPQPLMDLPDEALRTAGMSRAKVAAVKDLASKTLDGTVPTLVRLRRMDDEEIVSRLVQVRGVGRWTVEMLLIFRLGRPDVLPTSDLGVRKGFMLTYGGSQLPTAAELLLHAERWRPYRTVASWYMWRAAESAQRAAVNDQPMQA
jgi:3-methyladenine DNA glycosylase/8-oxoguanine DNA glycosylase